MRGDPASGLSAADSQRAAAEGVPTAEGVLAAEGCPPLRGTCC